MFRVALLIYTIASATLAGIFIVAVLTMGLDTTKPIVYAAVAGFLLAMPVTWIVARKISELR